MTYKKYSKVMLVFFGGILGVVFVLALWFPFQECIFYTVMSDLRLQEVLFRKKYPDVEFVKAKRSSMDVKTQQYTLNDCLELRYKEKTIAQLFENVEGLKYVQFLDPESGIIRAIGYFEDNTVTTIICLNNENTAYWAASNESDDEHENALYGPLHGDGFLWKDLNLDGIYDEKVLAGKDLEVCREVWINVNQKWLKVDTLSKKENRVTINTDNGRVEYMFDMDKGWVQDE